MSEEHVRIRKAGPSLTDSMDHRIVQRYGRRLKQCGLAVYWVLFNSHARGNEDVETITTLRKRIDMSYGTFVKNLRVLANEGLITIRRSTARRGKTTWRCYDFTLLPVPETSYDHLTYIAGETERLSKIETRIERLSKIESHSSVVDQEDGRAFPDPEGEKDPEKPPVYSRVPEEEDGHAAPDDAGNNPAGVAPDVSEGPAPAPGVPDALDEVARAVLAYLNQATGRRYGAVSLAPALKGIKARLFAGATHTDCFLVIDFCKHVLDVEQPRFVEKYLDITTPWRPRHFEKYLARARVWDARGRPPATPPAARPSPRARRHALVPSNGVLSNPRTRANVEGGKRAMARMQAAWAVEEAEDEA